MVSGVGECSKTLYIDQTHKYEIILAILILSFTAAEVTVLA